MKKFLLLIAVLPFFALTAVSVYAQSPSCVGGGCVIINGSSGSGATNGATTGTTPAPAATPVTNSTCPNGGTGGGSTGCNLGYTALEPIPGLTVQNGSNLVQPGNLHLIIDAIFKILITAGALIAVLSLTIGGVQYMVSGSAGGKNAGIKRAQASLWAILLIAGSWLILNTINPALLNFSLNPCPSGNCTVAPVINSTTSTVFPSANINSNSGLVPTIQSTTDGNAAIAAVQNTPAGQSVDPSVAQAAAQDKQLDEQTCLQQPGAVLVPSEPGNPNGGCLQSSSVHSNGAAFFNNCANIPLLSSGKSEACMYNPH